MLISGAFTCFSSTSFPVQRFAYPPLLSVNCVVPLGWVRAKSWLLGCPEVASLVSRGFCCGTRAPGCMVRLCHYVPTPDKEYFVGTALPFEVASFARLCDCYQALLSRELVDTAGFLQPLVPSSHTWAGPWVPSRLALLLGDRLPSPPAGLPSSPGHADPPCFGTCRAGGNGTTSVAVTQPLSLPCLAGAVLPPAPWEAALFPVLDR